MRQTSDPYPKTHIDRLSRAVSSSELDLHAQLDELVRATSEARDEIAGIEDLEEDEIERLKVART